MAPLFITAILLAFLAAAASDDGLHPLFFWVSPEIKQELLQAAADEQVPLSEIFQRWVDLRWAARSLFRHPENVSEVSESLPTVEEVSAHQEVTGITNHAKEVYDSLPGERRGMYVLQELDWAALREVGGKSRRVILTWTTGDKQEFVSLAENLALSIERHAPGLLPHFCTVALDQAAEEALQRRGLCVLRYRGNESPASAERWNFKKRLLATALVMQLEVLVLDADSVLLADPFATALWRDADLETGTDHFFPERDLLQPHMRPEEHLNTGFLFGDGRGASAARLFCFLAYFMEVFAETDWMGLGRDFFDQRAFNKFVLGQLASKPAAVKITYTNRSINLPGSWPAQRLAIAHLLQSQPRPQGLCPQIVEGQTMHIRVLDPEEVSHGMNFFWRATHLAPGNNLPSFVHANGVDEKLYFMRDRGIWFVDDWELRFPVATRRFLQYHHPQGQDLRGDFATLLAAMDLAKALKRRLVLPKTMRCANSPAHKAYGLLAENCTIDHFASAKILFHYHNESLVEASLPDNLHFRALKHSSQWVFGAGDAWESLLENPDAGSAAILVLEADVRFVSSAVSQSLESSGNLEERRCKFAYWPGRQMACRDEAFLQAFGQDRACKPQPGQEACGVRGFACCEVFHGWAEKLEFFTGQPWDLPCNCALDDPCARFYRVSDYPQLTENHRCCHRRDEDPPMLQCFDIGSFPASNPMMDFNSYSSDVLWAFDAGLLRPKDVFEACQRWTEAASVSMSLSTKPHDVGRDCTWIVSTFLLAREAHETLVHWLDYMFKEVRRPLFTKELVTVTMLTGLEDGSSFSLWKLYHDIQQLEFLVREMPKRGLNLLRAGLTLTWVKNDLLPKYVRLYDITNAGNARDEILKHFGDLEGFFNRAMLCDHSSAKLPPQMLTPAAADLITSGDLHNVLVVDEALSQSALEEVRWSLLSSTVWFGSQHGKEGNLISASLLDGLHSPLLLQLSQEVRRLLPQQLREHPLRDIVARKYHSSTRPHPGTSIHVLDAEVVACLWLLPATLPSHEVGGGLRVFNAEAPAEWSEADAFDWGRDLWPQSHKDNISLDEDTATSLLPLPNRLALWPGRRLVQSLATVKDWPLQGYEDSRIEVYLLFGSQRRFATNLT